MKKLILIGAGGHAKSCLEIIRQNKNFKIIGFIDNKKIKKFENLKILGSDKILKDIKKTYAFITIGQIKNFSTRWRIYKKLKRLKFKIPRFISKNSFVSKKNFIGIGTIVLQNAVLNRDTHIGENCIINSKALIEHGVKIENNTHISTGAMINGDVQIGSNTFIGSGAIIKEGVRIGNNCLVSMGSILKKNLKDYEKF